MKAKSGKVFRQAAILAVCILPLWSQPVLAERIKDLASIQVSLQKAREKLK